MPSCVSVPVLSNTTVSIVASDSRACRLRTRTPSRAKAPAAESMATGVAKDSAQGQVTISTATATIRACCGSLGHHHTSAASAASSTKTRKGRATRSASWANRGFCSEALSISATISANRVSAPTRSTRISTADSRLMLPAQTSPPTVRQRGADSPVSRASSTRVLPASNGPSAGNTSPGNTRSTSPSAMRRTPTRTKRPSSPRRSTLSGKRFIRASSAPAVRSRRRNSSQRPVSRKKTNMVSESKYTSRPKRPSGSKVPRLLTIKVIAMPSATGRSMLMRRWRISLRALAKKGPQANRTTGRQMTQEAQRSKPSISALRSPGCAM